MIGIVRDGEWPLATTPPRLQLSQDRSPDTINFPQVSVDTIMPSTAINPLITLFDTLLR